MGKYSLDKARGEALEMEKIMKNNAVDYAEAERFLEARGESDLNKPELKAQYDEISKEYSTIIENDPSKIFVQYPEALRLLGEIKNKNILDIGCGNGYFTRKMAKQGAKVVGYDVSAEQIKKAITENSKEHLEIDYIVSDPDKFKSDIEFDKAVSVLVLLYASSEEELIKFFTSTYNHLKESGKFVAITFNPNFKRRGVVAYDRRFSKTEDGKMKVEFVDKDDNIKFSAIFNDFSIRDYEKASVEAGFKKIHWEKLRINSKGREAINNEFWDGYEDDCPYIGLVAEK